MTDLHQDFWLSAHPMHPDLLAIKNLVYNPLKLKCSQPVMELESFEYGAYDFTLNNFSIKFRIAKITPTKTGQFVTLWKRHGKNPIQPYDIADPIDFFVISARKNDHFGQFIFPKSVLCQHDILSIKGIGGKRAIRVYPPWDTTTNRQATKTQQWQMDYFLDLPKNNEIDYHRVKILYSLID